MTRDGGQRDDLFRRGDNGGQQPTSLNDLIELRPFTAMEDGKGHDALLSARVPKPMARFLAELAFSRQTPYQTISDAVRDAIYLGLQLQRLRYSEAFSEAADAEAKALQLANEIAEDVMIADKVRNVADDLRKVEAAGELDRAVQRLTEYVRLVAGFGDLWRRRRYLHHLRGHATVRSLASHATAGDVQALLNGEGR